MSRRLRYHNRRLCYALLFSLTSLWIILPYDSYFVLQSRQRANSVAKYTKETLGFLTNHNLENAAISIHEIGLIIKTGYSTRERLPAKLQTLQSWDLDDIVIVSDYETELSIMTADDLPTRQVQVHDALARIMSEEWVDPNSRRTRLYRAFSEAVKNVSATNPIPHDLLTFGWELDIVKVRPAVLLFHGEPLEY